MLRPRSDELKPVLVSLSNKAVAEPVTPHVIKIDQMQPPIRCHQKVSRMQIAMRQMKVSQLMPDREESVRQPIELGGQQRVLLNEIIEVRSYDKLGQHERPKAKRSPTLFDHGQRSRSRYTSGQNLAAIDPGPKASRMDKQMPQGMQPSREAMLLEDSLIGDAEDRAVVIRLGRLTFMRCGIPFQIDKADERSRPIGQNSSRQKQ